MDPINRLLTWLAKSLVRAYRLVLSPFLGWHCRFYPTCSAYALDAIERYGWAKGSYLSLRRLLKCHPWHAGGCDELPPLILPTEPPEVTECKPNNAD